MALNIKLAGAALIAMVVCSILPQSAPLGRTPPRTVRLLALIEDVRKEEPGSPVRADSASRLIEEIKRAKRTHHISAVTPAVIEQLIWMLGQRDVRVYAAYALAFTGPSARVALPALQGALDDELRLEQGLTMRPETDAVSAVCAALLKVGHRTPSPCRD